MKRAWNGLKRLLIELKGAKIELKRALIGAEKGLIAVNEGVTNSACLPAMPPACPPVEAMLVEFKMNYEYEVVQKKNGRKNTTRAWNTE